ncbi:FUSC family protein [Legionella adelaidensis]|nr:FUSC family protein [Legionella adelaidensis]
MSISALIAYTLYRYFKWSEGYWSIISIGAITQLYFNNILLKMILRIAGTIIGASTAFYAVQFLPIYSLLFVFFFCLFLAILITLAASQYRYMMIITGLTFTLVIASGISNNIEEMAILRTYEVIAGCAITAGVSLLLAYFFPENKGTSNKFKLHFKFYPGIVLEAFLMSLACFLTFLSWKWLQYPFGFWAPITCLFVIEENIGKTMKNGKKRILAHIVAALCAGLVDLLIPQNNIVVAIPLVLGFAAIGYCLGIKGWIAEVVNTVAIAWSIMLLVDDPTMGHLSVVVARFLNVVYGVIVAFLVIYISSFLRKNNNRQ